MLWKAGVGGGGGGSGAGDGASTGGGGVAATCWARVLEGVEARPGGLQVRVLAWRLVLVQESLGQDALVQEEA